MNKEILDKIKECSCSSYVNGDFNEASSHWSRYKKDDKELLDVDFKNIGKISEDGRCIYFIHTCSKCGGKMINGSSFTDYSVTGEGIIINSIIESRKQLSTDFEVSIYTAIILIEEILKVYYQTEYQDFFDELKTLYKDKKDKVFTIQYDNKKYELIDVRGGNRLLLKNQPDSLFIEWNKCQFV